MSLRHVLMPIALVVALLWIARDLLRAFRSPDP